LKRGKGAGKNGGNPPQRGREGGEGARVVVRGAAGARKECDEHAPRGFPKKKDPAPPRHEPAVDLPPAERCCPGPGSAQGRWLGDRLGHAETPGYSAASGYGTGKHSFLPAPSGANGEDGDDGTRAALRRSLRPPAPRC